MLSRCASSSRLTSLGLDKYDVFLSFSGEDTRDNFTSHLYDALCRKKFKTFKGDDCLSRGDRISLALSRAIQESKVWVIIFSKGFASSTWCLDEVVNIMNQSIKNSNMQQIVIPVFYQVDPSHVRKQTGSFADAFDKHKKNFKDNPRKVEMWRTALTLATNLTGWDSNTTRPDSILVDKIVDDISKQLDQLTPKCSQSGLVGIEKHTNKVITLIAPGLQDFRMVGIWGMGGIGKTTVAKDVFSQLSGQFQVSCFLPNVRELTQQGIDGVIRLQQQFCLKVVGDRNLHTLTPLMDFSLDRTLQRKSVLVVCDDVSDPKQLDSLFEGLNQLGPGSRVVVTTRDKNVLRSFQVDDMYVYEVEHLNRDESGQLFRRHAFKTEHPLEHWQKELSKTLISYAGGNPLVLKVTGSSLCGKNQEYCQDKLKKLGKISNPDVLKLLRISYDGLEDDEQKDIFLDLACFNELMFGYPVLGERILKSCYISVDSGIRDLIHKSLIEINDESRSITKIIRYQMHELIQEMGRDVVYQECKAEPGKRSRLWTTEDVIHVLANDTGTETIRAIVLRVGEVTDDCLQLSPTAFVKMHGLKFLYISSSYVFYPDASGTYFKRTHLPDGLESLPSGLRFLHWERYPLKSLPSKFDPRKLVELNMSGSDVEQLWEGVKDIPNLKVLTLDSCRNLITVPDLSSAKMLEVFSARGCTSLLQVPPSIGHLYHLISLDLAHCRKLMALPSLKRLTSLESLYLSGCSNIDKFPEILSIKLQQLYIDETAIEEVSPSIGYLCQLQHISMRSCTRLKNLPNAVRNLGSLSYLHLSKSPNVTQFPEISATNLTDLHIVETAIEEVPSSISCLSALRELRLNDCRKLKRISNSICKLKSLQLLEFKDCSRLESFPEISETMDALKNVDLSGAAIKELSSSKMEYLPNLRVLKLNHCENLEHLPNSFHSLRYLEELCLESCTRLKSLSAALPARLRHLDAHNCTLMEEVSNIKQLFEQAIIYAVYLSLTFSNCFNLKTNDLQDATLYLTNLLKFRQKARPWGLKFKTCFPGSDVPKWFHHESVGSSVTIRLPPYRYDYWRVFNSFILCTIVSFQQYSELEGDSYCSPPFIEFKLHLRNSFGDNLYLSKDLELDSGEHALLNGDQIFLWTDTWVCYPSWDDSASGCYYNEASFSFYLSDQFRPEGRTLELKKCGVHLLYTPDKDQTNHQLYCMLEGSNKCQRVGSHLEQWEENSYF